MKTKLAAIVWCAKARPTVLAPTPGHHMIKLFNDGSSCPVADDAFERAITWAQNHGYRARGYWINNQPAIAWSPTVEDLRQAWGTLVLTAPCTFARHNNHHASRRIGQAGYLVPTRRRHEIHRLRQQYPSWTYQGDLIMVPVEILDQYKARAEAQWQRDQRAAAAYNLADIVRTHYSTPA